MDNEGLLEWAKHEVARTKEMLKRAEDYVEELQYKIECDIADIYRGEYIKERLRCMGIPEDIWRNIGSLKELIKVAKERETFLNANKENGKEWK